MLLVELVTKKRPRNVLGSQRFNDTFQLDSKRGLELVKVDSHRWIITAPLEADIEVFDFFKQSFVPMPRDLIEYTNAEGSLDMIDGMEVGQKPYFDTNENKTVIRGGQTFASMSELPADDEYLYVLTTQALNTFATSRKRREKRRPELDVDIVGREDRRVKEDVFEVPELSSVAELPPKLDVDFHGPDKPVRGRRKRALGTEQPEKLDIFCSNVCQVNPDQEGCDECVDPEEAKEIKEAISEACRAKPQICPQEKGKKHECIPCKDEETTCAPDPVVSHAYQRGDISWPAEVKMPPSEWSAIEPLLKLQHEWDIRVQNNTVRILTQNLHFRPYDLGSALRTFLETVGAETSMMKEVRDTLSSGFTTLTAAGGWGLLGGIINIPALLTVGVAAGVSKAALNFVKNLAFTKIPLALKEMILRNMEFTQEDRAWINKKFPQFVTSGQLFNECIELHTQNAQERRACEFVGAITRMQEHERPHIICIQEATHEAANRILYDKLEFIGYEGEKQVDYTAVMPYLNPPGLAIFVNKKSGMKITKTDSLIFGAGWINETLDDIDVDDPRLLDGPIAAYLSSERKVVGADILGYKGCFASELLVPAGVAGMDEDTYIIVATIHPSPYVKIETGDTLFSLSTWFCRVEDYGEVVKVHQQQLDDTAKFLRRFRNERVEEHVRSGRLKRGSTIQLYMTGDMNINRYAVTPDSKGEKNPFDASACCSIEYYDMLRRLNAEQPPVIPDVNQDRWVTYTTKWEQTEGNEDKKWKQTPTFPIKMPAGRGGMFTWDGEVNGITKSPKWPESFSWIDFILYSKEGPAPLYMDNRAVRLTSKDEFPEVSTYFQPTCVMFRKELVNRYNRLLPKVETKIKEQRSNLKHAIKIEKGGRLEKMRDLMGEFLEDNKYQPSAAAEKKTLDNLIRRKRDLKEKICSLQKVNNQQKCDTTKTCTTFNVNDYENTYTTDDGKEFTCDYKPRVTISQKNLDPYKNKAEGFRGLSKAGAAKLTALLNSLAENLRKIQMLAPELQLDPEFNDDGTVSINRGEYADKSFFPEERDVMQKNPYPMFKDISDHYAVLSYIMLPSDTNKRLFDETMGEYRREGIEVLPVRQTDMLPEPAAIRFAGAMPSATDFVYPSNTSKPTETVPTKLIDDGANEIAGVQPEKEPEWKQKMRVRYTKPTGLLSYFGSSKGVLSAEQVEEILDRATDEYRAQAALQNAEMARMTFEEKKKAGYAVSAQLPPPMPSHRFDRSPRRK